MTAQTQTQRHPPLNKNHTHHLDPLETLNTPAQPNYTKLPMELLENMYSSNQNKGPRLNTQTKLPTPNNPSIQDADELAAVRKRILAIQSETQQARKAIDKAEEERHKNFSELQETWHPQHTEAIVEPQGKVTGFGAKRKKSSNTLPTLETKPTKGKG